jgi:hypothetical protein
LTALLAPPAGAQDKQAMIDEALAGDMQNGGASNIDPFATAPAPTINGLSKART